MKTSTRCCVRAAALTVVFAAPSTIPTAAQDLQLIGGASVYAEESELCLSPDAFLNLFELSGGSNKVGGMVTYSRSHPWPTPPGGGTESDIAHPGAPNLLGGPRTIATAQEQAFLSSGDAIRIMAETFPVALLTGLPGQREGFLNDINRYVRPFIGAGVFIRGDGDTAPVGENGRDLPTFGLEGSTNLILSYGARAYLPGRDRRVRFTVLYRGNTLFMNEVVYRTPDNETLRGDGETQTWGEWGVGVSVRIGGG